MVRVSREKQTEMEQINGLPLVLLLLIALALSACQTTPSVIDAGCIIWERNKLKPSRLDTDETIRRLHVLNEAMTATCR